MDYRVWFYGHPDARPHCYEWRPGRYAAAAITTPAGLDGRAGATTSDGRRFQGKCLLPIYMCVYVWGRRNAAMRTTSHPFPEPKMGSDDHKPSSLKGHKRAPPPLACLN